MSKVTRRRFIKAAGAGSLGITATAVAAPAIAQSVSGGQVAAGSELA